MKLKLKLIDFNTPEIGQINSSGGFVFSEQIEIKQIKKQNDKEEELPEEWEDVELKIEIRYTGERSLWWRKQLKVGVGVGSSSGATALAEQPAMLKLVFIYASILNVVLHSKMLL